MVPLAGRRGFDEALSTAEKGQLSGACGMAAEGVEAMGQGSVVVAVVAAVETHMD